MFFYSANANPLMKNKTNNSDKSITYTENTIRKKRKFLKNHCFEKPMLRSYHVGGKKYKFSGMETNFFSHKNIPITIILGIISSGLICNPSLVLATPTTFNATSPIDNSLMTFNATSPIDNSLMTFNATSPIDNSLMTFNATSPIDNSLMTFNATSPIDNSLMTFNATSPIDNSLMTFNATSPIDNSLMTFNATSPANDNSMANNSTFTRP